jgi:hypothetical protein
MTHDDSDSSNIIDTTRTQTRRRVLASATSTLALGATAGCLSGNSDSNDRDSDRSDDNSEPDPSTTSAVFQSIDIGRHNLTVRLEDPDSLRSVALKRPTDGVIDRKQAQEEVEILLMGSLGYAPGEFVLEARTENEVVGEHTFELRPEPRVTSVELLQNQDREELTDAEGEECASRPKEHIFAIKNVGTGPAALEDMKFEIPDNLHWREVPGFDCHEPGYDVEWDGGPVLAPNEELEFAPIPQLFSGYREHDPGDSYEVKLGPVEELTGDWFEQTATMEFIDIGEGNRYPIFEVPAVSED